MKFKMTKNKVIASIIVAIILIATFWYGGNAPGLRGWKPEPSLTDEVAVGSIEQQELEENHKQINDKVEIKDEKIDDVIEENLKEIEEEPVDDENTLDETLVEDESLEKVEDKVEAGVEEKPKEEKPADKPEPKPVSKPEVSVPEKKDSENQGMVINKETGKDKYLTEPVPEGKPVPVEPQNSKITDVAYSCTLSVRADTILKNIDWLDSEKVELVPEDGVIFPTTTATFYDGESVFNVLQREMKKAKIHMEFMNTPIYNSAYIEGIKNLYEFDCGELSGWMYRVNGWFPNYGSSRYKLKDGDIIEWLYTCDLGVDIGGHNSMRR